MNSFEHFDLLLGDALERLIEASDEAKELSDINNKSLRMKIGKIVSGIWNVREEIYEKHPEIKRDFIVEYENDKKRFEDLNQLHRNALNLEKEHSDSAEKFYKNLYDSSGFGYFRLLAEAGLYRVSKKAETNEKAEK